MEGMPYAEEIAREEDQRKGHVISGWQRGVGDSKKKKENLREYPRNFKVGPQKGNRRRSLKWLQMAAENIQKDKAPSERSNRRKKNWDLWGSVSQGV